MSRFTQACRSIVNFNLTLPDKTPAPKAPMLLAKCCDMLLKKGGTTRHVPEGEVFDKLTHLVCGHVAIARNY